MNKIFKNENSFFGKIEKLFWTFYQKEPFRFLIAGGINTLLGIITSMLIRALFTNAGWNPKINFEIFHLIGIDTLNMDFPYLIAFVILLPVAYTLQAFISFQTKWSFKRFLIYPLSSIPNFILQEFFIWLFEIVLHLPYRLAYILSPIVALPIMFVIIRFLVKPRKKKANKIKAIFLDIDGTLIDSNAELHQRTIEAVNKIKDKYLVFLASGRNYMGVKAIYDQLDLNTEIICTNGALVTTIDKHVSLSNNIDINLAREIYEKYKDYNVSLNVYDEFGWYVNKKNKYTRLEESILRLKAKKINTLDGIDKIQKLMIISEDSYVDKLCEEIKAQYPNLCIVKSKAMFLEITNIGIEKGFAIKHIQEKYNIKKEECASFGDSRLDNTMFDECGVNYAMKNATQELKDKATYVIKSNDECGVAEILEKNY